MGLNSLEVINSLSYYLPKRKPISAYISDVCAHISGFWKIAWLNDKLEKRLVKRLGQRLYKR